MMDAGDSRKLGSFSGSTLTKKSMNFIRDAYSLAQNTFNDRPDGQQHPQQSAGLSQHFNNNSYNQNYSHPVASPYLQPSAALSPNPPQQWPRPPPSPNRPTQAPANSLYHQNSISQRPHQVGAHYVPGQGMVSPPLGNEGRIPQRHNSNASADPYAHLPPPPPYAPPQHSPSPPLPAQPAQQHPSQLPTPDSNQAWTAPPPRRPSTSHQPEQPSWTASRPPMPAVSPRPEQPAWNAASPSQRPSTSHQPEQTAWTVPPPPVPSVSPQPEQPAWNSSSPRPSVSSQSGQPAWMSAPPRPSVSPQPEQQTQWSNTTHAEQHQAAPVQQQTYQAFSQPSQQSQAAHPVPQRHQTLPPGQYRPYQYQPHHSNSYPATGMAHRPSTSHGNSTAAPPLPDRPTPPLPQRPQWQAPPLAGYAELPSPPPQQQQHTHQPPAGYAELPSPPQQQQQQQQPQSQPQQSYFTPPPGIAEMYAPPPPPPPSAAPTGYAELPGHEQQTQQKPAQQTYQAHHADVKPPVHQYHGQHGGHSIPQMAELPG